MIIVVKTKKSPGQIYAKQNMVFNIWTQEYSEYVKSMHRSSEENKENNTNNDEKAKQTLTTTDDDGKQVR